MNIEPLDIDVLDFDQEEIQEMEGAILDFVNNVGMYSDDEFNAEELNRAQRIHLANRAILRCDYGTPKKGIFDYYEESLAQQILALHAKYSDVLESAQALVAND